MTQTPFKTTKGSFLAVTGFPEDAKKFCIVGNHLRWKSNLLKFWWDLVVLPPGQWEIIGWSGELNEEQMKGIVESIHIELAPNPYNDFQGGYDIGYVDYENPGEYAGWQGDAGAFSKIEQSFSSLLQSNNIPERALILKLKE